MPGSPPPADSPPSRLVQMGSSAEAALTSALDAVGGVNSPGARISSFEKAPRASAPRDIESGPVDADDGEEDDEDGEDEDEYYIDEWDDEDIEDFTFYSNIPSRVGSVDDLTALAEEDDAVGDLPAYNEADPANVKRRASMIAAEVVAKQAQDSERRAQLTADERLAHDLQAEEAAAAEREQKRRRERAAAKEKAAASGSAHRTKPRPRDPGASKTSPEGFSYYSDGTNKPSKSQPNQLAHVSTDKHGQPHNKNSVAIPKALYNPKVRKQLAKMKTHKPYFIATISIIQTIILILTFVFYYLESGSFIDTDTPNWMAGPKTDILIGFGVRYVPCMRPVTNNGTAGLDCPKGVQGSLPGGLCTTKDLERSCGLAGFMGDQPDQWYRFILAVFVHSGIVHWAFVMLLHHRMALQMEKDFGWLRIGIIYVLSGIGGFIFGANFSTGFGCGGTGSICGLIACLLLDLLQNWGLLVRPFPELIKMIFFITCVFFLGFLPWFDPFTHVGGFGTGILAGLMFMPSIHFSKWDTRRKRFLMIVALPCLVTLFTIGITAFQNGTTACSWCQYIQCLPFLKSLCNSSFLSNVSAV